jgi:hypothetical protein
MQVQTLPVGAERKEMIAFVSTSLNVKVECGEAGTIEEGTLMTIKSDGKAYVFRDSSTEIICGFLVGQFTPQLDNGINIIRQGRMRTYGSTVLIPGEFVYADHDKAGHITTYGEELDIVVGLAISQDEFVIIM